MSTLTATIIAGTFLFLFGTSIIMLIKFSANHNTDVQRLFYIVAITGITCFVFALIFIGIAKMNKQTSNESTRTIYLEIPNN